MARTTARNSSTPYALLGMLTLGPMSGYEMRQTMQQSIAHFWSESYGQIYPTLKKLEKQGMVACKKEKKKGEPEKLIYSITAAGRKALDQWLAEAPYAQPIRSELLLKVFFAQHAPELVLGHVERTAEHTARELAHYKGVHAWLTREHKNDPNLPHWLMTLRLGVLRTEATHQWAVETAKQLKSKTRKHA